jgi:endonuclease/exonuclease/phosphatase family metal-dependent hydrolase
MRIGAFNVENLFDRPKALNQEDWRTGRAVLEAHAALSLLLEQEVYSPADKTRILGLLEELGLLRADEAKFARLRRIRGALLRRSRGRDGVQVVARGRPSWIGFVELVTESINERAMMHTAMVIRDVGADVLGVVEAESRPTLQMFSDRMLARVEGRRYEQVMLVDGNDMRGIDVGLLARGSLPITAIRPHIFDTDGDGVIFSRDCCAYHLETPGGERLVVLVNHLKSKGYGDPGDPIGANRRRRQATRVAQIYKRLLADGAKYVCVVGDLNDDPESEALAPLLQGTSLRDISEHPDFDFGPRRGTFKGGNATQKIDYVLLSPALFRRASGGAVFRKGVWRGPRTRQPWEIYPTLTAEVQAASDHAAIYADVRL